MKRFCLIVLCASATLSGCTASEPKPEFKAVATTQDVMEGLMADAAQKIWDSVKTEIDEKGVHETRPQTKEDWQHLAHYARGLAESASLLLYDGRLEDHGDWEKFTKELSDKALAAAKAADDQDADAIIQTGGDIYEACSKCHETYLERVQMKRTGGKPSEAPASTPPGASPSAPGSK
jgi:hypothetical protein